MQNYEVKCPVHGPGETVGTMRQAMDQHLPCWTEGCDCTVERFYPRGRYGFDHTENTFHPWTSEQLSIHGDPVYVKSRAEEHGLMQNMGLQRWEPGMKSGTAQQSEANRRRKEKAKSESR